LNSQQGSLLGITHEQVAQAIAAAAERTYLLECGFSGYEVNELFFINSTPLDFGKHRAKWLLLPYCSKDLECKYRKTPGCDECGECLIADGYGLAKAFNLTPYTIQSFEHLMSVLKTDCSGSDDIYLGSCCEAFYAKHQSEMRDISAKGILVNLDSTTCYDLGKGTTAYKGEFDNQTQLNIDLIEKTLRLLNAASNM
jgi:lipoate-protein ligase A